MITIDKLVPVEIIQALAGSGKTQLLAYRFLRLMKLGADPTTILATTFSKKAAGEIRDRIVEMLANAILQQDKLDELIVGVPEIESEEDCVALLKQLVTMMHRLNIGTIDSFFVKSALAFSDILELSQGWAILDKVHEDQVFADAILRLTKDNAMTKKLATTLRLSKSGAKVPICKTVANIKDDTIFSVRDAGDIPETWVWGKKKQTLSTQDVESAIANAEKLQLDKSTQRKALAKAIDAMRSGDWKSFLTAGMAPSIINGSFKYYNAVLESSVVEVYNPLIEHGFAVMANRMLMKNEATYELMREFGKHWLEAKHERGLYSFDDVTYQLSNSDIMEQLLELQFRMDGTINHMLVDEFQDTSLTQWRVLEPLIDEINQAEQDRSLFFVGDVKQSLYGFRGGEPALLRGLEDRLVHARTTRLEVSWRCTPPILDAVNTLFGNIQHSSLLSDHATNASAVWMQDFDKHTSAKPTQEKKGFAVIQTTGSDQDKTNLQLCVDKVVEIVAKIHQDAPAAHIGILVRSNTKQQIQRIVHALRTNDIHVPASEFGGNPLTDSPAVTVILSALLMADDHCNSVHQFHVESSPLGKYLGLSYPAKSEDIDAVSKIIRSKLLKDGYADVVNEYAEQLVEFVDKRERLRLWQLVELAESYATEKTLRPTEFVRVVKEIQVQDPASSQVQVMTVHKSKGLSFDAVVVCDLDQAIWKTPDMMELHDNPCALPIRAGMYAGEYLDIAIPEYIEMREETHVGQVNDAMCLFYVAMTRAKHAMHIVIPYREKATTHYKRLDGLLLQGFNLGCQQKPDNIIWEAEGNDPSWVSEFVVHSDVETDSIPHVVIQQPDNPFELGRGIALSSPSSLEGGGKTKVSERFSGDANTAFDRGTIVHKWFEDIEWFDEVPTIKTLVTSTPCEERRRLGEERLVQAAENFINALQSSQIQQLLAKPEGNVRVFREQEFVVRVEKGLNFAGVEMNEPTDIHGSIDRLVVYFDENGTAIRAEVIDWKTDSFSPDELSTKIQHYAPQLSAYRLAASKLLGIESEQVRATLVFSSTGEVHDITDKT
jgi:ATP-dependent exoDNAse (exonuclease V) beta subunit